MSTAESMNGGRFSTSPTGPLYGTRVTGATEQIRAASVAFGREPRLLHSLDDIAAFAARLDIAPGIVVGRLQREGILGWNQGNGLKKRLRFVEE